MTSQAQIEDTATLEEMKKTDVSLFTQKLRRVMAGQSRKDAAAKLGVKDVTLRAWISQGNMPTPPQAAQLAKFAECSIAYLCDNDIPVDADPKEGGDSVPMSDGELVARLRGRYIEESERLHDYLDEIQGIDWHDIGGRLLDGYAPKLLKGQDPGSFPPDIERAAEVLSAMRVLIPHTIGPFIPSFNTDTVDERLRPEALKRRMDGLAFAQTVRLVMDLLPNLNGLAAAARRGTEHDTSGVARLFDELRAELKRHEESGDHLLETCAGVLEAGGVGSYAAAVFSQARAQIMAKVKAGGIKSTDYSALAKIIGEAISGIIQDDLIRQGICEAKADEAWRQDEAIKSKTTPTSDPNLQARIMERSKRRAMMIGAATAVYMESHKG